MFQKLHIWRNRGGIGFLPLICFVMLMGCEDSTRPKSEKASLQTSTSETASQTIVHLYFADKDNSYLFAEERSFSAQENSILMGKHIINGLLEGPRKNLARTIPEQTVLRAFYLMTDGIAVVDLSGEIKEYHSGGAKSELMTIYSLVNSLVLNIPEIKAVKLLIEGREEETLAGHIDLRNPFKANMLYVR